MATKPYRLLMFLLIIISTCSSMSVTSAQKKQPIIIAIDAGHGGKDPGAIGPNGVMEKEINFAVATKLQRLLQSDPMFNAVLTRTGDYYISVSERSEIARTKKANFLVSIHADAAQNSNARGASVWVLSNKRADSELGKWLESQDKQSALLGGVGQALSQGQNNIYFNQTVLDLQFAHSQRVAYDTASYVLKRLNKVVQLHKKRPEHVSFGVLRSPDIPSILIEVGFISNRLEEQLFTSQSYQDKLAKAIYLGIRDYFIQHNDEKGNNQNINSNNYPDIRVIPTNIVQSKLAGSKQEKKSPFVHTVSANETLFSIARRYHSSIEQIMMANKLKKSTIYIGQKLTIPMPMTAIQSGNSKIANPNRTKAKIAKDKKENKKQPSKTAQLSPRPSKQVKKSAIRQTKPTKTPATTRQQNTANHSKKANTVPKSVRKKPEK